MNINEVIQAGNSLSVAADSLSQHADLIIAAAEKAIAAFSAGSIPLTPDQAAAVQNWKDITVTTGAHRDAVDAEVANLDKVLPTPAPDGTLIPTGDQSPTSVETQDDATSPKAKKVAPVDK